MVNVNGEEYLTVKEAARVLGVKPATLYAYVSRGVLRSYRQGIKRQRLYRRAEVEGLLRLAPSATRGSNVIPRADFPAHAFGINPRRLAMILSTIRFGSSPVIRCRIGSGAIW